MNGASKKQSNGSLVSIESAARLVELQEACDRLKQDLSNSVKQCNDFGSRYLHKTCFHFDFDILIYLFESKYLLRNAELENQLSAAQKDVRVAQEQSTKLQNHLHEVNIYLIKFGFALKIIF